MGETENGEQFALTAKVMERVRLSPAEAWLHYMNMGGGIDEFGFNAYLHGLVQLPAIDRDMIAHAVNELYNDVCRGGRAPYSDEVRKGRHCGDR